MEKEISSGGDTPEIDGEHRPLQDDFLENLVGKWEITGNVLGQPLTQRGEGVWALNHQFLLLHFKASDEASGATDPPYEAMVFIGFDNLSERYVAHWLDTFGGRFSETLGYGKRKNGDRAMALMFEGGSGPLRNTLSWDASASTWKMVIEQKNQKGHWYIFAEETFRRVSKP